MPRARAVSTESETSGATSDAVLLRILPIGLLIAAACLFYANAWHDALVFDDKPLAQVERFADWSAIPSYFLENAWAARGLDTNLYRPLLAISIAVDANLHGDWFAGYHLSNTLLHALVTVFVFALIRQLLVTEGRAERSSALVAFLVALVFAVHPVNTEVVNSVFNRSSLLSALGMTVGLWCLLRFLQSRPILAWSGLFAAYTFALFCRETAIVLPAVAVIWVYLYADGAAAERLRKTLPALSLLIPMIVYLVLRSQALSGPAEAGDVPAAGNFVSGVFAQVDPSRVLDGTRLLQVAGVWAEALRLTVWPLELQVAREPPAVLTRWIGLFLHLGLLGLAVYRYRQGSRGLLAGFALFYLVLLPPSRLFGETVMEPHLTERYLYEPLIGLAIVLAYGLIFLATRFDRMLAAALALLAIFLLAPATWARNAQWADELLLFENNYRLGVRTPYILRLLTAAHLRRGSFADVSAICDDNRELSVEPGPYTVHCASAYSYLGRDDDAVRAYLEAADLGTQRRLALWNLGQHYMRRQRHDEAAVQFERAVEAERDPAAKAYYKAYSIMLLNPSEPARWREAREYLLQAVQLRPGYSSAQSLLDEIDAALGIVAEELP